MQSKHTYSELQKKIENLTLPCVLLDMGAFERNIKAVTILFERSKKTVRIATKSLRTPYLLKKILDSGKPFSGLMNYSAHEIEFLAGEGFDDFWLAYPIASIHEALALKRVHNSKKKVRAVVDSLKGIEILLSAMKDVTSPFEVAIDVDVGFTFLGFHLGAKRSPIRCEKELLLLIEEINKHRNILKLIGAQAYEAHVAGLTDQNPFKKFLNPVTHVLRKIFANQVAKKREMFAKVFEKQKIALTVFNGGGTGSANFCLTENILTEVSVGSAFFSPLLFDYYSNLKYEPALFFALQVVRHPENVVVTCQGGGYVASGEMGGDRLPQPLLPQGAKLLTIEGVGEVQTPVDLSHCRERAVIGDPIFFRHAKAGELCERFNEIWVLEENQNIKPKAIQTYRGHGKSFF